MKKVFFSVCASAALLFASCAAVQSPVMGALYSDVASPVAVTSNAGSSKVGSAKAVSYLGLIALGDVSVETIAKEAGIKKIHHVDQHSSNILGILGTYTVFVYGE
ncbi:hypothetical protein AwDysgo_06110 [Bacteroidales bacterium]|nr:hypothetical protein AwDysgo_06110 [Bacteroidales bacterium]